jgi:hypothetical protein
MSMKSDFPSARFPRLADAMVKLQLNVEIRRAILSAIDQDLAGPAAAHSAGAVQSGSWDQTLDNLGISRRPDESGEEFR